MFRASFYFLFSLCLIIFEVDSKMFLVKTQGNGYANNNTVIDNDIFGAIKRYRYIKDIKARN